MKHRQRHRNNGFTLLELLIALAIFGLLSVMSYSGLRSVMDQHARTEEVADRLAELQKIYLVMQRDIEQIVPRSIRDEYGDQLPALVGDEFLQFTRGGWSNPLQRPRSSLQRVGYAFEDDELVRYTWQVLDRAQDTEPLKQPLTSTVSNMTMRYLAYSDEWLTSWPQEDQGGQVGGSAIVKQFVQQAITGANSSGGNTGSASGISASLVALPKVIEVTLTHEYFGDLVWLFRTSE